MANWRKLAMALALADGRIDNRETAIMRQEIFGDNKVDREELEFLLEIRKRAASVTADYDQMVFQALTPVILADGEIDAREAAWLRKFIYADGKVSEAEKQFLTTLKTRAKSTCPEFDELYQQATS